MSDNIEDATVIETKPLPKMDIGDAVMMAGSFFAGYFIGKQNRRKAVSKAKTGSKKRIKK